MKLIAATVTKESADSKVGIGLRAANGNVFINSIAVDGLFSSSNLKVGHQVLSINGNNTQGMTSIEAIKLVKSVAGTLTIVATDEDPMASTTSNETLITATVTKESADSKVGIGLRAINRKVFISSITNDGLFSSTCSILKVGHRVLSVNDNDVQGMSSTEAITLVKSAPSTLTIVATEDPMGSFVTIRDGETLARRLQAVELRHAGEEPRQHAANMQQSLTTAPSSTPPALPSPNAIPENWTSQERQCVANALRTTGYRVKIFSLHRRDVGRYELTHPFETVNNVPVRYIVDFSTPFKIKIDFRGRVVAIPAGRGRFVNEWDLRHEQKRDTQLRIMLKKRFSNHKVKFIQHDFYW